MAIYPSCIGRFSGPVLAWFVVSIFAGGLCAQSTNVAVRPVSAWVRPVVWTPLAQATNQTSEGTYYLLYERQHHPQLQERYERIVMLMQNETGVQDSGNLTFHFDPSHEELVLHGVRIHRQGQALNRLEKSKIRVIQREPGLGGHLFTGEQSAVLFVEDLRVGDLLEYDYTVRGANPVLGKHFSTRLIVQSGMPVARQRLRVVWAAERPLQIRPHLTTLAPVQTAAGAGTDYLWDFTNLTAIAWEDYTPASFEPYPYLEVSDFENWARVVEWALPLYEIPKTNLPPDLQKLIEGWRRQTAADGERARLALQFVQDELRYTGLELGPDSYRPAPPFETFEKRYGDCKGKVLLLCSIYRELGLQAWPALVSTYSKAGIGRRLPSPFAFNHVIIKLQIAGRTYWLDPTVSHQGGELPVRAVPSFGQALVVQPGVTELENILRVPEDRALQRVLSTFRMTAHDAPVRLTVQTVHRGVSADDTRETMARADKEKLAKDYLNFYARYYPGIQIQSPPDFSDDRSANILTVIEHYEITNLWKLDPAKSRWEASFYPENMQNMLTDPGTRLRQRPLRIPFPLRREQEIVVHLPDDDWKIPTQTDVVEHEAFSFRHQRQMGGSILRLHYRCQTKVEEIPASLVPGYLSKRGEMDDLLGDTLFRPDKSSRTLVARINWLMLVIVLFGTCATVAGCVWLWRRPRIETVPPMPLPGDEKLRGLGGWLWLVGIGVCVGPVARLVTLGLNWEGYFLIHGWQDVAVPSGENYHPLYAPLLIFEALGNILMLGLNVMLIGFFFTKRRLFPATYIALMAGNAAFLLVDEILASQIPAVKAQGGGTSTKEVTRALFQTCLWTAYMLKSRRVKLTFVR